jgi:zinc/manganese transport system substrate-binding protein
VRATGMSFAVAALLAIAGCSTASSAEPPSSRVLRVVAAENFWGSIAAQLGGSHVSVINIIHSPDADPHDYEPTTNDGRRIATADLVIVNGIGYDPWASKIAKANHTSGQVDLTVGDLVGVPDGGNPHRWYNPDDVQKVVDQVTADYIKLEPSHAAYFAYKKAQFDTSATAAYHAVIAQIKASYAGTPVGASESIFAMIAPALGLDLITPPDFLKAVSEGNDPTVADKATIDAQIKNRQIKVYVYNSQNATPDIQAQVKEAQAAGIPVTTITETLTPATASWEEWQTRQLDALRDALAKAGAS